MKFKRRKIYGRVMIIISLTVLLSFTGLSYAYWSDSINVSTSAIMANTDVHFATDNDTLSYVTDSTVSDSSNNTIDMKITLKRGESISKTFSVQNGGSIPVRLNDSTTGGSNIKIYNGTNLFSKDDGISSTSKGIKIVLSPFLANPIKPQEKNSLGKITISINNAVSGNWFYVPPGQYTFLATLYYNQWTSFTGDFTTGTYGSWKKKIIIRGTIDVI